MKLIAFVFATLWYFAHAQEEEASTFLRDAQGDSGENNGNVKLAIAVKEGVEPTTNNVDTTNYDVDDGGMNLHGRQLQSLGDWNFCSSSSQCRNGCCSMLYSNDGRLKCTPVGGFQASHCVAGGGGGPAPTPTPPPPTPPVGGSGTLGTLTDWATCAGSYQCRNGCCSRLYSNDGSLICTPVEDVYASHCVSGTFGASGSRGDWNFCSTHQQCRNNCCSNRYSNDGKLKCTPGGC